jgi:hypothetical protein
MIRPEIRYNSYSKNTGNAVNEKGNLSPGDKNNEADDETVLALGVEYIF